VSQSLEHWRLRWLERLEPPGGWLALDADGSNRVEEGEFLEAAKSAQPPTLLATAFESQCSSDLRSRRRIGGGGG